MIPYHGTPVGGTRIGAAQFLTGRHALVSFANPEDMSIVAEACSSFVLDNGAYTMWQGGVTPDWDAHSEWVGLWSRHPGFDWWLIPDTIDGTLDDNKRLIFHYGRKAHLGVPVFHMHESVDHLKNLARDWPRIALGSSGEWKTPGTDSWWARMGEIMDAVCDGDGRPVCKLHCLRMLDPLIFSRIPLSSADSCNAVVNSGSIGRFGMYPSPQSWQRAVVIAQRIENHNSPAVWERHPQENLFELLHPQQKPKKKSIHNVKSIPIGINKCEIPKSAVGESSIEYGIKLSELVAIPEFQAILLNTPHEDPK